MTKLAKFAVFAALAAAVLAAPGCSTTTTTITKTYGKDGKIVSETVKEEKAGPLRHKMVTGGVGGGCFEVTTAADPSTGTMLPTIKAAYGEGFVADTPIPENTTDTSYEYFYFEKSIWSNTAAVSRYIKSGAGQAGVAAKPSVTIAIDIEKTVSGEPGGPLDNIAK